MNLHASTALAAALALAAAAGAAHAADAAHGKALYERTCSACHSIEYPAAGPAHKGLFGRKAGSSPGYSYSPALKQSSVVWDEKTLDRWLAGPEALIPGQRMNVSVPDAGERADIIAYLAVATRAPKAGAQ
jgi:cytochrome c